jgi:hypothetical protein
MNTLYVVEYKDMSGLDEQKAILDSAAYWGLNIGSSSPDCGAIPKVETRHRTNEVNEDTLRVMAFSAIAGVQIIARLPSETSQDFRARIDAKMSTPE